MKKIISLLTIAVLVAVLATAAFATEAPALEIADVEGAAGAEVIMNVAIVNNPGITVGEFRVTVDSENLELVDMAFVGMEDWQWDTTGINPATGKVVVLADAIKDYKLEGDCVLVTLTVKVKEGTLPGKYAVNAVVDYIGDDDADFIVEETFTGYVVVPCTEHVWDEGVVKTPATCKDEGVMLYTCTLCGETKEEPIATVDHTWGEWEVTTPASCGVDGVETRTCSVCGETETRAIEAMEHAWGEWEVTTPASCGTAGVETRTCANCGETETREIPALEHTWGEWELTTPATCCEAGVETRTCSACGETETQEVAATGEHKLVYEAIDDVDHKIICENSGKELGKEEHTFGEMIEDTENPGWQYQLCDKCGYKLLDETGDTGDHSMIAVAAATLSMLGIALVVSKKKEF